MASYIPPTLTGYNANPPPDDGSQSGLNEVAWDKHIDKIGDPLKDFSEAIDSATTTAFTTVDADIVAIDARLDVIEVDGNKYAVDTGAANTLTVALSPAVTAYTAGLVVRTVALNTNTGATTLIVNGVTPAQTVITTDGNALAENRILAGGLYVFVHDGTDFQLINPEQTTIRNTWVDIGTGEPAISTTLQSFTQATLGLSTWEGVGPTASGELNIWTALDSVPTDADWIDVFYEFDIISAVGGVNGELYARANGSTATFDNTTMICSTEGSFGGATTARSVASGTMRIPVVGRVFDIATTGAYNTMAMFIRLIGYGRN